MEYRIKCRDIENVDERRDDKSEEREELGENTILYNRR